jgi:GntR family transcriptional regulator
MPKTSKKIKAEQDTESLEAISGHSSKADPDDAQTASRKLVRTHIPLYYQLEQILRQQIAEGKIPPDKALPTENELCKQFGVSRTTFRQAVAPLMREGLINRIPGKGSYLLDGKSRATILIYSKSLEGLVPIQDAMGKAEVHYKGWVFPPAEVASLFGLRPDQKAYRIRGVHLQKSGSTLYGFDVLIPPEYARLFEGEKEIGVVFATIVNNVPGKSVQKVKQIINAIKADEKLAEILEIYKGDPVLQFERVWYGFDQKVFMVATTFYNSANFHFVMELEQER